MLVKVLRVGVDGTDREINAAEYGAAPQGYDFLVIGHEGFGQVEAVGPDVTFLKPGDYVVATVRRPGTSLYDAIGLQDMTTDTEYFERGINLRHGYLTEYYVEDEAFVVKVPQGLKDVGVLLEPMTVAQKGITQAYEIQRRMKVWRPRKAAVMGAGTLGLLASLVLRLRGLDVTTFGRTPKPYLNADLLEAIGARYVNTAERSIADAAAAHGPFDLIFEGTGSSAVVFDSMLALAKKRRARAVEHYRRQPHARGSRRPDQPGVRARQQGDGRHGQRQPRELRDRRRRHGAGRSRVSGLAAAAADAPRARPRQLSPAVRSPPASERRDQNLLRGRR